jgi:carbamoyltransferase
MGIILGLNAYHADSSACIIKDTQLQFAIEEERLNRIKHWAGFPSQAIEFCLKEANITIDQVDHICIGRDPKAKVWNKAKYVIRSLAQKNSLIFERLKNRGKINLLNP